MFTMYQPRYTAPALRNIPHRDSYPPSTNHPHPQLPSLLPLPPQPKRLQQLIPHHHPRQPNLPPPNLPPPNILLLRPHKILMLPLVKHNNLPPSSPFNLNLKPKPAKHPRPIPIRKNRPLLPPPPPPPPLRNKPHHPPRDKPNLLPHFPRTTRQYRRIPRVYRPAGRLP
ncbi:hypothetical protein CCMA1212_001404 [Trichoderma ghanense]|uniref:Uncharacterized protein n=1 Tax=Trichoderma ghanense TaxID=65468 RepID=A0ABY2HDT4_9HYPO